MEAADLVLGYRRLSINVDGDRRLGNVVDGDRRLSNVVDGDNDDCVDDDE